MWAFWLSSKLCRSLPSSANSHWFDFGGIPYQGKLKVAALTLMMCCLSTQNTPFSTKLRFGDPEHSVQHFNGVLKGLQ